MMSLRVAVAEDEPLARDRLRRQLVECGCEVVAAFADGPALLAWLRSAPGVDALFLDIEMPGATGFDVIAQLGPGVRLPPLVFVTAYAAHSLRAFDVEAVDYLVKPVRAERLARTVERLRRSGRPSDQPGLAAQPGASGLPAGQGSRFPARHGAGHVILQLERVTHFEMDDEIVYAWVRGRRFRTPWRRLSEVESTFPTAAMMRIQRHLLLRPEVVVALTPVLGGRLRVSVGDGVELVASRSASSPLKSRLRL
jgi:two-component system, LytTR family, response regulator